MSQSTSNVTHHPSSIYAVYFNCAVFKLGKMHELEAELNMRDAIAASLIDDVSSQVGSYGVGAPLQTPGLLHLRLRT